ncbi:MAG: hypothetical protein JSR26_08455 [Proteobacteria bacterium]|nr:hypothetical protein [Pseudomonadota bacterium]
MNAMMESERAGIAAAIASFPDRDPLLTALQFAGSYTRAEALLRIYDRPDVMPDTEWFTRCGEAWVDCDNVGIYRKQFARIFRSASRNELNLMMDAKERAAWGDLPDMLTVFRGCYDFNRLGLSWTLSRDVALNFVTKFVRYVRPGYMPLILTGRVHKSRVVLKLERNEQEVIAPRVRVVATMSVTTEGAA